MDQVSIKYANIFDYPKFTQLWILGLKTNHLATLLLTADAYVRGQKEWKMLMATLVNNQQPLLFIIQPFTSSGYFGTFRVAINLKRQRFCKLLSGLRQFCSALKNGHLRITFQVQQCTLYVRMQLIFERAKPWKRVFQFFCKNVVILL
jgi:hypothetical protein